MNDRKVLRVSGPDAEQFLQGLVTNDVLRVKDGPVYAAMLTAQGKYRADFFLVPAPKPAPVPEGDDILIDVAQSLSADLLRALTMYKLRAKVTVTETDLSVSRGPGAAPDGAFDDPRDPRMGWRAYDGRPSVDADWDALRVDALIPESGIELTPDTFILEAGFERLAGVDFKKGCYVGQEVTARMKHKTELRKGLATVTVDGSAPVGTPILSGDRPAGVLFTQSAGRGIAYLRFDRANGALSAGDAQVSYAP